jgi:hypothetical protein
MACAQYLLPAVIFAFQLLIPDLANAKRGAAVRTPISQANNFPSPLTVEAQRITKKMEANNIPSQQIL